jgi:hypothetical protein
LGCGIFRVILNDFSVMEETVKGIQLEWNFNDEKTGLICGLNLISC